MSSDIKPLEPICNRSRSLILPYSLFNFVFDWTTHQSMPLSDYTAKYAALKLHNKICRFETTQQNMPL